MNGTPSQQKKINTPAPKVELVGFVAGQLKLKPGDALPTEFVIPLGTMDARSRGQVIVNERTLAGFEAFQKSQRHGHVMLDFNHNTLPGSKEPEPRAKAAKLTAHAVPGVGIVCKVDYWTPVGRKMAQGGHFPDISPAVWRDSSGVVLGLHSVALCEHGELQHERLELFTAAAAGDSTETNNNTNKTTKAMDFKKLICKMLGLPEDASDEQITAAVAAKEGEGGGAAVEGMSAGGKLHPDIAAFMRETRTALTGFNTTLATMKKDNEAVQIDGFIAAATEAGKEIKMERADLLTMGPVLAQKYLDGLSAGAVVVTKGAEQGNKNAKVAKGRNGKGGDPELHGFSAAEAKVLRDGGVSLEDAAKARDLQAGQAASGGDDGDDDGGDGGDDQS